MEKDEKEHSDQWNAKSSHLKSKVQRKKQKLKPMYRTKYDKHANKLKLKYNKRISILEKIHEKSIRHKYLMGASDERFTIEEWQERQLHLEKE